MNLPSVSYKTTLRIVGVHDLHNEITEQLGILPTKQRKSGESMEKAYPFLKDQTFPNDIWLLDAPESLQNDLLRQLQWFQDKLSKKSEYLKKVKSLGGEIDIFCKCKLRGEMAQFSFSSELQKVLSECSIPINVLLIKC